MSSPFETSKSVVSRPWTTLNFFARAWCLVNHNTLYSRKIVTFPVGVKGGVITLDCAFWALSFACCDASRLAFANLFCTWRSWNLARHSEKYSVRCMGATVPLGFTGNFSSGRNTSRESSRCFLREYSRASNQCLMNAIARVPYFSLFKLKMIQSPDRGLTRTSELESSAYAALRHMIFSMQILYISGDSEHHSQRRISPIHSKHHFFLQVFHISALYSL